MLRVGTFMAVTVALRAFGADDACSTAQQAALQCAAYGTYSAYSCDPARDAGLAAIAAKVSAAAEARKKTVKDRESLQAACRESLQLHQEYRTALEQFKTACESQRQTCASFCTGARPWIPGCAADAVALTAAVNGSESGCRNLANRVSQASALQAEADRNIALAQSCLASSSAVSAPPPASSAFGAVTASSAPEKATETAAGAAELREVASVEPKGRSEAEPSSRPETEPGIHQETGPAAAEPTDAARARISETKRPRSFTTPTESPVAARTGVSSSAAATAETGSEPRSVSTIATPAKAGSETPDLRRFLPGADLSPERVSGRDAREKLGLCPRTRGLFECVSERYRSQQDQLIGPEEEFSK